jgi:Transglycosylase SLT domain
VSSAGAQGIAQFMPETATSMGLENPFDPAQAIPASARLLRELIHQFGNLGLAAAAYNAGPRRIQDWLEKKGKLPEETKGYVKIITGQPAETWTAAAAAHPGQRVPRHAPCQEAAGLYAFAGPETIPLPVASPRTQPTAPVAPTKLAAAEPARTAFKLASSSIKISHHGSRVTAVIEMAKPARSDAVQAAKAEAQNIKAQPHVTKIAAQDAKKDSKKNTKAVSQQLAARKQKPEKRKFEKLAQR